MYPMLQNHFQIQNRLPNFSGGFIWENVSPTSLDINRFELGNSEEKEFCFGSENLTMFVDSIVDGWLRSMYKAHQ